MSRLVQSKLSARAELLAYASLGFAAVAAVVIAAGATFNFANGLDQIANRLKPAPAAIAKSGTAACEPDSPTNIAGIEWHLAPSGQAHEAKPPATGPTVRDETALPTG